MTNIPTSAEKIGKYVDEIRQLLGNKISHKIDDLLGFINVELGSHIPECGGCKMKDYNLNLERKRTAFYANMLEEIRVYIGSYSEITIVEDIKDYISKQGDKTQLKKRVKELENENSVLKGLISR